MTRNNNSNQTKTRRILTLLVITVLCFVTCFSVACNKAPSKKEDPKYSYTEEDESIIKNGSFAYGTMGSKLSDFPKTSPSGWSLSKTATSKSGVIDVSEKGWEKLWYNFYEDNGIKEYLKLKYGYNDDDIKQAIKNEKGNDDTPSSADIKDFIVNHYYLNGEHKFVNPSVHTDASDNKVYMLNNYKNGETGYGVVQNVSSSTSVKLNKGEYAEISVYVKTANLTSKYAEAKGATVLIKNNFNSKSQPVFEIRNIISNDEWKEVSFFVKADSVYDTDFTIELGLGFDDFAVEGTVYFDDVTVTHLTETEFNTAIDGKNPETKPMIFNGEDDIYLDNRYVASDKYILYDMSLDLSALVTPVAFNNAFDNQTYYHETKTNVGDVDNNFDGKTASASNKTFNAEDKVPNGATSGIEVNVKNSSLTIKFDNNGVDFVVNSKEYASVSFYIKNNLSELSSKVITIDLFDTYKYNDNGAEITETEKRPAVAKFETVSDEWQKCTIVVKNNFEQITKTGFTFPTERYFNIEIVVGPTDVSSTNILDYATGTVLFTTPEVRIDSYKQYATDEDKENDIENVNYKYYDLLTSSSSGQTALYAGYNGDYTADEADAETYPLVVSPSDLGVIYNAPANSKEYKGVGSDHGYIKEDSEIFDINTSEKAGLINTKYLANYESNGLTGITSALSYVSEDDKNIQPLMIYSEGGASYGFIGDTIKVEKSSYAKVTLNVKVAGNAVANIYLVDVLQPSKPVLTFDKFTVNTDGLNSVDGKEYENLKFEFKITSDMMDDNGWATISFYIATGSTSKNFRLEMWNGSRDNAVTPEGYVFFNEIVTSTSSAFTEPAKWQHAFSTSGNPLFDEGKEAFDNDNLLMYHRQLTADEIKFNKTADPDKKINYSPSYVWAKNDSIVYGIFNTVDPVVVDPFDKPAEEDTEKPEEQKKDPSAFWMSLSSILLGVALVGAIVALIVKNVKNKNKKHADDAKSHYTVKSRTVKPSSKSKEKFVESKPEIDEDEPVAPVDEQPEDASDEQNEEREQTLDDYVYGDVQDFGSDSDENKDDDDK